MNIDKQIKRAQEIFQNTSQPQVYFAPGRVNLIGEHIDYHGGKVLPCAINYGTYLVIHKRDDDKIRGYSENFQSIGIKETTIDNIKKIKSDDWFNYPKGVVKTFLNNGYTIDTGFDMYFYGNIPNGAGLSSSASVELVTAEALKHLFDLTIEKKEMVILSQKAENEFIGVNCGIMDQYAVGFGKKDKAVLLDCDVIKHDYIDLALDDYAIVITNTNIKRGLDGSDYNTRRVESFKGLEILQQEMNIKKLVDCSSQTLEEHKDLFEENDVYKRVKHIVSENERSIKASKALENGEIKRFGQLMNRSHISLRDDFEVSCKELDFLVAQSLQIDDVIGSRMTGAGFGGCTVSLVKENKVETFCQTIESSYEDAFGFEPSTYVVTSSDGSHQVK